MKIVYPKSTLNDIEQAIDLIGREQGRCAATKIDCLYGGIAQIIALQLYLECHCPQHIVFIPQRCGKVEIAVHTCLPAKGDVQVNSGGGRLSGVQ